METLILFVTILAVVAVAFAVLCVVVLSWSLGRMNPIQYAIWKSSAKLPLWPYLGGLLGAAWLIARCFA